MAMNHAYTRTPFMIPPATQPQGLLGKLLAFILSASLLVLGFMFSLVALAVIAIAGIALGGWLWWKTRALRRQMRDDIAAAPSAQPAPMDDGAIIEGEFIREQPDNGPRLR